MLLNRRSAAIASSPRRMWAVAQRPGGLCLASAVPSPARRRQITLPRLLLPCQQGFQLAMTRALGHRLLSEYGVDATPSGEWEVDWNTGWIEGLPACLLLSASPTSSSAAAPCCAPLPPCRSLPPHSDVPHADAAARLPHLRH